MLLYNLIDESIRPKQNIALDIYFFTVESHNRWRGQTKFVLKKSTN